MISRRLLLQLGARSLGVAGGFGLLRLGRMTAFAQSASDYRALVCVFLNGGNDGHNTVVPLASSEYQAYATARAGLALPRSTLLPIITASGSAYRLHPKLAGLQPLFQQQQLGIVANVGMLVQPLTRDEYRQHVGQLPRNLFSHTDQQLAWHRAAPAGQAVTGWAGRVADRLAMSGDPNAFPTVLSVANDDVFGTGATSMPAAVFPGSTPRAADGFRGGGPSAVPRAAPPWTPAPFWFRRPTLAREQDCDMQPA